ncbi:hypothetical protein HYU22_02080 [Candidatus Woesearchaeota archaeon]|nr:hypothetical protein [Candidatus Woesearchaeota archaeon]
MITLDELRELKFSGDQRVQYTFFPCRPEGEVLVTIENFLRYKKAMYVEYHRPNHGVDIPRDGFVAFYRNKEYS